MQEKDKIPVGKAKDISGQKYGRLTVLYRVAPPANITTKKPKVFGNVFVNVEIIQQQQQID